MGNNSSILNETISSSCIEFDPEGLQYIKWIYIVFGECVHSAREQASFYMGMASLFCWIFALLPQIISNFKNKDASSLSIGFLIPSTIGDTCNMIACILSGQLMTQIFLATYFVMIDFVIVGQYIFYSLIHLGLWNKLFATDKKKKKKNEENQEDHHVNNIELNDNHSHTDDEHIIFSDDEHHHHDDIHQVSLLPNSKSKSKLKVATITILASVLFISSFLILSNRNELIESEFVKSSKTTTGRKLLRHSSEEILHITTNSINNAYQQQSDGPKHNDFAFPPNTTISMVGFIIGCVCSVMYMFSRWPQIYKNYKRQSTEGLSKVFFIVAIFGNIFYLVSIWLFSSDGEYLLTRLPWLAETHVNVCLDTVIFFQIIYYSRRKEYKDKMAKLQTAASATVSSNTNTFLTNTTTTTSATFVPIKDEEEIMSHVEFNQKETISTINPSLADNNY